MNARLLGTEFVRSSDPELVARALYRLVAVYGDPWGADRSRARVMTDEWVAALGDLPAVTVDDAVTEWLRSNSKWPRPADIRAVADRLLRGPIAEAAQRHGMHPARINPPETIRGFLFEQSQLRKHPEWGRWLDAQHPTLEHSFFRNALCSVPHEVFGLTDFEAAYIAQKHGAGLTRHFGRPVCLGIGPHPCREVRWTDEPVRAPTDEERARVSVLVGEYLKRGDDAERTSKRAGGDASRAGASPEFVAAFGEGAQ